MCAWVVINARWYKNCLAKCEWSWHGLERQKHSVQDDSITPGALVQASVLEHSIAKLIMIKGTAGAGHAWTLQHIGGPAP